MRAGPSTPAIATFEAEDPTALALQALRKDRVAIIKDVLAGETVDQLNAISLFGYNLGFWFAQQGSIYVFVILIFFYASRMKKLDREHDVHED